MGPEACAVFYLTNQQRAQAGKPPLGFCERCFRMAQDQSEDMASRGYFSHDRPASGASPAESFSQRADRFGLHNWAGENIAMASSAENAMDLWMHSDGHRRNILSDQYDSFAVGYQDGLFTQDFWKQAAP
jgi:uncharacterized protein YkwD